MIEVKMRSVTYFDIAIGTRHLRTPVHFLPMRTCDLLGRNLEPSPSVDSVPIGVVVVRMIRKIYVEYGFFLTKDLIRTCVLRAQ